MISYLDFEKPVAALEARITELRAAAEGDDVDISQELERLEAKSAQLLASTYASLTPWQKAQVARHPMRPHFRDYVERVFEDFIPLAVIAILARMRRSWADLPGWGAAA